LNFDIILKLYFITVSYVGCAWFGDLVIVIKNSQICVITITMWHKFHNLAIRYL